MGKHIVIDARQYSTSSGRYVRELIDSLESIDKQNRYSVLLSSKDFDLYSPLNENFSKVLADQSQFGLSGQFQLLLLLKKLKPDLVHFAFVQQPLLFNGQRVTTIHDTTPLMFNSGGMNPLLYWTKKTLYRVMIQTALSKSKYILTPTKYVKTDLSNLSKKHSHKLVVTYEAGVNSEGHKKVYGPLKGKEFIMYTGRASAHKNLMALVDAFKIAKVSRPNLYLVFVGNDKNYAGIKNHVDKIKVDDVHFTGYLQDPELNWLYSQTEAYVFPSLSEGFGLPGLEAMARSAPVISSNATCLPEVYEDAAHYFNPRDEIEMAEAILEVLTNKKLKQSLIKKGNKQWRKYSWERMAKQTLDIYQKVLS